MVDDPWGGQVEAPAWRRLRQADAFGVHGRKRRGIPQDRADAPLNDVETSMRGIGLPAIGDGAGSSQRIGIVRHALPLRRGHVGLSTLPQSASWTILGTILGTNPRPIAGRGQVSTTRQGPVARSRSDERLAPRHQSRSRNDSAASRPGSDRAYDRAEDLGSSGDDWSIDRPPRVDVGIPE
jgi:hypothetical protein